MPCKCALKLTSAAVNGMDDEEENSVRQQRYTELTVILQKTKTIILDRPLGRVCWLAALRYRAPFVSLIPRQRDHPHTARRISRSRRFIPLPCHRTVGGMKVQANTAQRDPPPSEQTSPPRRGQGRAGPRERGERGEHPRIRRKK
jgi:hypothetical protein